MQLSDDDRITYRPPGRSPATWFAVLLLVTAGAGGGIWYYLKKTGNDEPVIALKQAVQDKIQPAVVTPPPVPAMPTPAAEQQPDPVAASEPPLEPAAEAEPLPPLDSSDSGIKHELSALAGWQVHTFSLMMNDQWLRRFVTLVTNVAAGKIDHKSGPLLPIKGHFAVSNTTPLTSTPDSQARYNVYVNAITALDPQQVAALYRRYYPLLNSAYQELGEKNNFHALVLKAIQQLENTPELTEAPALVPAEKGLYKYAQPQLESLPAVQKQLLRSGWENVSKLKIWLRQLRSALLTPPA